MNHTHLPIFCALSASIFALPDASFAGVQDHEIKSPLEKTRESCITGDIGVDVVSQFIRLGIPLEDQAAIVQPYIDLSMKVYEGDGWLTKAAVDFRFWNSLHSRRTGASADSTTDSWFESDFVVGVSLALARNFVVSPYYHAYLSPSDAFSTAHTFGVRFSYSDTDALGPFALHPYALVQWDADGSPGNGGDEGVYYEAGISPGMQCGPFLLRLPIAAGFGSGGFYAGGRGFGYFSIGVDAEYALACVPASLGAWSLHAHATYYFLGEGTEKANVPLIRDRDDSEWVFGGGLKVAF